MLFKKVKNFIYSFFREFLVFHHSSLEFRAKVLAAMISAKKDIDECEKELLREIAYHIYKNDEDRAQILINITMEYVEKVKDSMNGLFVDDLILDIDKSLKAHSKFYKKIDIENLKKFLKCKASMDEKFLRVRIIEYFQNELRCKSG